MTDAADLPYRWDLVAPDRLGSLLDGASPPRLWFLDELVLAAGKVLARSGGGHVVFVGRSLDSMFDLLSGALSGISGAPTLARLPVSFARPFVPRGRWGGHSSVLTPGQIHRVRDILREIDAAPAAIVTRRRPTAFVDVVHRGSTFTDLYGVIRDWLDEERTDRSSARRKLRFVGVTSREQTSPNTFRWHQHAPWTSDLPASGVLNVSVHAHTWGYLADQQTKLTRTFPPAPVDRRPRGRARAKADRIVDEEGRPISGGDVRGAARAAPARCPRRGRRSGRGGQVGRGQAIALTGCGCRACSHRALAARPRDASRQTSLTPAEVRRAAFRPPSAPRTPSRPRAQPRPTGRGRTPGRAT